VKYRRGGEANLCCSVLTFPVEEAAPTEIAAEVFGGDAVEARHPAARFQAGPCISASGAEEEPTGFAARLRITTSREDQSGRQGQDARY
jgi:hypothetical protein